MVKLRCISPYQNKDLSFKAGDEFSANDDLYRLLVADSPGSFEEVKPWLEMEIPGGTKVVRKRGKNTTP